MVTSCIRPTGRVRIETENTGELLACVVGCIRPTGRVRIETVGGAAIHL